MLQKRARKTWTDALVILILIVVALLPFTVSAQSGVTPGSQRMFGAGAPFTIQDLPPGQLRADLERLNLNPQAQQRALKWLHSFSFPASDAAFLRVDPQGGVFYADPVHPADPEPAATKPNKKSSSTSPTPTVEAIQSSVTFDKVFNLHSKPGAPKTVYLNFVGGVVSGTAWNNASGRASHTMLPFSEDSDPNTFNQSELDIIAEVWKRISEDFAPFDINVTTKPPVSFGPQTGHILFSPRKDADGYNIYANSAGGVAYVNVWGRSDYTYYQPALVFPEGTGRNAHNMAEAASHELGHNLALSHDGRTSPSEGYYYGHGSGFTDWAPIMGVGYSAHVTQWSKGEYAYASQTQDDLAVIANRLTYRPDDHSNTTTGATPLVVTNGNEVTSTSLVLDPDNLRPENKGIIGTRADVDHFYVDTTSGTIDLIITPAWIDVFKTGSWRGTNLDIKATLLNSAGAEIASSSQSTDTFARVTANVTSGRYFLRIDGEGAGADPTTGYNDYGSLGYYFINGTLPAGSTSTPSYLMSVSKSGTGTGTVTSSPAGIDCGTDCSESYTGGQSVTLTATPASGSSFSGWSGACAGTGSCTVTVNSNQTVGAVFNAQVVTTPAPAAPSTLSATAVSRTQINLAWTDNAGNETGFRVERSTNNKSFSLIATLTANSTSFSNTGLKSNTTYYYRVSAYNSGGTSAYSNTVTAKTPR
jgi:hypothetical protein